MPRPPSQSSSPSRRATNVTLPEQLLAEAREMGINLSQACERGLVAAVSEHRRQKWLADNQEAIASYNNYVSAYGLPLASYRQF